MFRGHTRLRFFGFWPESSYSLLQMHTTVRITDMPVSPTLDVRKQTVPMQDMGQMEQTFDSVESPAKISLNKKFENYIPATECLQKTPKKYVRSKSYDCISNRELIHEPRTSRSDGCGINDVLRRDEILNRRGKRLSRMKDYLRRKDDYLCRTTDDLCRTFSSLNVGEASTSYHDFFSTKSLLLPTYKSSSLPYVGSGYIPVRNKYSDFEDEIEVNDQPIDFSRKYSEINPTVEETKDTKKSYTKIDGSNTYGIYAETDLDQTIDYSLRYAEDDSDSDISETKNSYVQVKTYCTEGTPDETPFNFSTATSMSDLRMEEKTTDNKHTTIENKEVKSSAPLLDDKNYVDVEDMSEIENKPKSNSKKILNFFKFLKSEFISGMMSPEKPVNYFSRVSSFGSLNSIPVNETSKKEESPKSEINEIVVQADTSTNKGTKAVKFEQTVNYAEETPLMFSRTSSLASLDSVEQHSIHDDRSSVISDLSRLTSGIVSPSELPDSPTQTVPPSPKPRKNPLEYPSTSWESPNLFIPGIATDGRPIPRSTHKPSVFEDDVTKFKEERTPMQFSTATSLSSLTIDDHDEPTTVQVKMLPPEDKHIENTISTSSAECSIKQDEELKKRDAECEKQDNAHLNEKLDHISQNAKDDDILANCINLGMRSIRHRFRDNLTTRKMPTQTFKYSGKNHSQGNDISLTETGIQSRCVSESSHIPMTSEIQPDSIKTYCTEDTPATLSHAGSNSDISVLSIPNDTKIKSYLSEDTSIHWTDYHEKLLAECIHAGMPKTKKLTSNDFFDDLKEVGSSDCTSGIPLEGNISTCNSGTSRIPTTVDWTDYDEKLLAECIQAGMPKTKKPVIKQSSQESVNVLKLVNSTRCIPGTSHVPKTIDWTDYDEKLLAECIQAGMPKAKKPVNKQSAQDLIRHDSKQGSTSDFESALPETDILTHCIPGTSRISTTVDWTDHDEKLLSECIQAGMSKVKKPINKESSRQILTLVKNISARSSAQNIKTTPTHRKLSTSKEIKEEHCNLSRQESLLSVDSIGSLDNEQALLEQCISLGMPKSKTETLMCSKTPEKPVSMSIRQFNIPNKIKFENEFKKEKFDGGNKEKTSNSKFYVAPAAENSSNSRQIYRNHSHDTRRKPRRKRRLRPESQSSEYYSTARENAGKYITGQILAYHRELIDRSKEEWI